MFTLSFSKILMTFRGVVMAWRGWRFYQGMQARLASSNNRAGDNRPAPRATDLVECVRCGMFVPNGTVCRSLEECRFRRG